MKKIALFFLFLLTSLCIFSEDSVALNIYSNIELDYLTQELGNSYYENVFVINFDYKLKYETEPNYFNYFTKEELSNGVEIKMREWDLEEKHILTWSRKNEKNKWIIFYSLEYGNSVEF